jgi:hypothetical protein
VIALIPELANVMVNGFVYPLAVIVIGCLFFLTIGFIIYYRFLRRFIPEKLVTIVGFIGMIVITWQVTDHTESVNNFVASIGLGKIVAASIVLLVVLVVLGIGSLKGRNKRRVDSPISVERTQVAATAEKMCSCGSVMVQRKSKSGQLFWGCSRFPVCRHTESI